jgi:hypothetical protein
MAIWQSIIAEKAMAIPQSFIAKQAMPFWQSLIVEKAMAILQSFIAKQAMPFGDHLSLKKRWQFGYVILHNIRRQFGDTQLLRVCG